MENQFGLKILKSLNILYLEDEDNIRENVSKVLSFICKNVYSARNVNEALEFFKNEQIDIILSDINMPEFSGIDFVKKIRKYNKVIPIIMLTAHTDTNFLLEATKLKLIDYLIKPLNLEELKNALCSAALEYQDNIGLIINFQNSIEYHIDKKQLFENGVRKDITNKEILLLTYLYENKHRTVSKDEIKNHLWEDSYEATDTALKSVLNKLRNKIGKESIKNISGVGYQIQVI